MSRVIDLTDQKFGRLLVVGRAGSRKADGCVRSTWHCKCDCGAEKIVPASYLRNYGDSKGTRSCGCLQKERQRANALRLQLGITRQCTDEEAILESLYAEVKNTSRRRKRIFELTLEQFKVIISKHCFYCNEAPKTKRRLGTYTAKTVLAHGIDRVDSSNGYVMNNCVPCCSDCNRAKSDRSLNDWLTHIKKLSQNISKLESFVNGTP